MPVSGRKPKGQIIVRYAVIDSPDDPPKRHEPNIDTIPGGLA